MKMKHSPIILKGLKEKSDKKACEKTEQTSEKSDKVSEEKEAKEDDDFDYSSFKSSRRVSLSKKLRDPDADKKTVRSVSQSLGPVPESKDAEDSIEISSQSLRTIIPDVQPLTESELKLTESDDKDDSLGSLSDDELRKRKILLQEKLKGLEEENNPKLRKKRRDDAAAKLKTEAVDSNGYGKKQANHDLEHFADAEEEEKALRLAAQQSMKDKIAKKEELKRRLSSEEAKPKRVKREDRGESPAPARKVRAVEGPAVVVRKPPTIAPARHATTCVVIIRNLTRPFTLRQLQTLLQRTGRIVKDGFWVDMIKSVCLAQVHCLECSIFVLFHNVSFYI